jgi:hypothetical protein
MEPYEPGTVGWLIAQLTGRDRTIYVYIDERKRGESPRILTEVNFVPDRSWDEPATHEDHIILEAL